MAQEVRTGLIGYGYWGPNYARIFGELPNSKVGAICEVAPDRLSLARSRYPRIPIFTNMREILCRTDLDAFVVSTPASTHYELAKAVLESGRHVLVEKPMALQVEHCERLCELAGRAGRVLMVAHTFLYNPGIRKMKECMQVPDFGRAYYLHSTRTNLGPIRADVNAIWDLAPHDISIFNYLLDQQPQWASAIGAQVLENRREDVGFITLGYAGGVIGNIHVSWADPNKVREVVAVGSGRRVVFNDLDDLERVRVFEKGVSVGESNAESYGEFKLLVRDGDIISPKVELSEPMKNQCADFLAAILTNQKPVSDHVTGLQVVHTLLAVEASMRARGAAKEIPPYSRTTGFAARG